MKEWRWDRLREHLRREGWARSLLSPLRALIVAAWLIADAVMHPPLWWVLALLGSLSVIQIFLRRQPYPVWTAKAQLMLLLVLGIDVAAILLLLFSDATYTGVLPILQPLVALLAWVILHPLDTILKRYVMRAAEQLRARYPDAVVIGIAGSVGKTTTKELLRCVLQDLHPLVTPAHVNTEMGVAQWLLRELPKQKDQRPLLIVEMGAYAEGEIALLCRISKPTMGVLTAIGSDHLALFGSEEAIERANRELLHALPPGSPAFEYAKLHPESCSEDGEGLHMMMDGHTFHIPLRGEHNAGNVLLAYNVAKHVGLAPSRIAELLREFHGLPGTFAVREERGVTLLNDTYNVSPLSFRAGLAWAAKQSQRPRVLLTSGLLETGSEEDRFLKELGHLAATNIERAIFTTEQGRNSFAQTFGRTVELLSPSTKPVPPGSLLLCIGRMPLANIQRMLPS